MALPRIDIYDFMVYAVVMIWLVAAAFFFDLLAGDPQKWWHPVRAMGAVIEWLHPLVERRGKGAASAECGSAAPAHCGSTDTDTDTEQILHSPSDNLRKILRGALYPLTLCGISAVVAVFIALLPTPFREILTVYVLYTALAARSLAAEVMKVLVISDLNARRKALSMLCSRDTDALDERGIYSTLFETVSENSVDGVLAPLFYMLFSVIISGVFAIGGMDDPRGTVLILTAVLCYKSVSTCDSMVGYKNDRFIYTGRISARLDDILNYVPARFSQIFVLMAGFLVIAFRSTWRDASISASVSSAFVGAARGLQVYFRDRYRHESPNSAHPMSMFAGLLGVRIAGPVPYFGKLKEKEYLGDDINPLNATAVKEAVHIMLLSAALMLGAAVVVAL